MIDDRLTLPAQRRCGRCGLVKHIDDFARRSDRPCGRKSLCLVCDRIKARRYYAANRAAVLQRQHDGRKRSETAVS